MRPVRAVCWVWPSRPTSPSTACSTCTFRPPPTTGSSNENCSPSGVAVARGREWVGALRGEALWSVDLEGPGKGRKIRHFHQRFGRIRTVQKAPDGSLWITTSNQDGRNPDGPNPGDDKVLRITVG